MVAAQKLAELICPSGVDPALKQILAYEYYHHPGQVVSVKKIYNDY